MRKSRSIIIHLSLPLSFFCGAGAFSHVVQAALQSHAKGTAVIRTSLCLVHQRSFSLFILAANTPMEMFGSDCVFLFLSMSLTLCLCLCVWSLVNSFSRKLRPCLSRPLPRLPLKYRIVPTQQKQTKSGRKQDCSWRLKGKELASHSWPRQNGRTVQFWEEGWSGELDSPRPWIFWTSSIVPL